jgi:predicted transcriptional regulator
VADELVDDLKKKILERTEELGLTVYAVQKGLEGQISRRSIGEYYKGDHDLSGKKLSKLLEFLGLQITPKKGFKLSSRGVG